MAHGLDWLTGKQLLEVGNRERRWYFTFTDGGTVVCQTTWRLVTPLGVIVAASDHGQRFDSVGIVDAPTRVLSATMKRSVTEIMLDKGTSDLRLLFGDGVILEFLSMSCGRESWTAHWGEDEVSCLGGGQLAVHSLAENIPAEASMRVWGRR